MDNNIHQNFLIGALVGGLAGAAAVLLLTPISGEKIRSKLMNGFTHDIKAHKVKKTHAKARRGSGKRKVHHHAS